MVKECVIGPVILARQTTTTTMQTESHWGTTQRCRFILKKKGVLGEALRRCSVRVSETLPRLKAKQTSARSAGCEELLACAD